MTDLKLIERIVIDPKIMVGKPTVKGTRLTVQLVLSLLSKGMTHEEIMDEYPSLTQDDILACLMFATKALDDIRFVNFSIQ
jgi:uncharacterized protein (DUF433 family)